MAPDRRAGGGPIRRRFADVDFGQVHYRHAGSGAPIVTLHGSPGSSRQLVGLIEDLSGFAQVFSPDTPGNGDSTAIVDGPVTIAELAEGLIAFLDSAGLEKVSLYGSHTGGAIAAEIAIRAPEKVQRLIIDGVMRLTPAELEEILANYAFPFPPDLDGAYLMRAFLFCRDQYVFYPWYKRTRDARRDCDLPNPHDLHAWVVEVLKASETYHQNYRAAFQWDAEARLPLITVPTMITAAQTDPLLESSEAMTPLLPNGRFVGLPRSDAPDFRAVRAATIADFLAENDS